jgi:hypothetical protein
MASTDAKSGFRLPWSTDRAESDDQDTAGAEPTAVDQTGPQTESETPTMIETAPTPSSEAVQDEPAVPTQAASDTSAAAPMRKANKFMADLTKAMQVAAEAARTDTLERFSAEAKAHIESIHASTSDASTELRKKADDDLAALRAVSQQECARTREETDERVTHRKEVLEREIEAHAAEIESRIERVQTRVAAFEAEMDGFFERLLAEGDPTRFAAMAETLPEPPPFDADAAWVASAAPAQETQETPAAMDPWVDAPFAQAPVVDVPVAETSVAETPVEAPPESVDEPVGDPVAETTPVEAMPDEPAASDTGWGSADNGDLFGIATEEPAPVAEADPRLVALGVEQDFAAAEAEAAAYPVETANPDDEIPTIPEDALAARLAGLVAEDHSASADVATTRVVVTGLVSVASIAGFKRNLARVSGVRSVGGSSGPDGEFVFAVTHEPELGLADGIATLPGFSARVTNEAPGELTVAARDPESEG